MISRRQFLVGSSLAGLGACTNIPTSQYVADAVAVANRPDVYPMSAEQIEASPYALMGVRVGEANRAVLVLAKAEGDDLHWISGDRAVLVTRYGRIIKTIGFKLNLRETLMPSSVLSGFSDPQGAMLPSEAQLQMEFQGTQTLSLAARVRYQKNQSESAAGLTVELQEALRIVSLKWSAANSYRYEATSGRFVSSRQSLHPQIPLFELEVLKHYQA